MTLTWACVTNALGDSCGSEDLNVIDGVWIGDSSPTCSYSAISYRKSSPVKWLRYMVAQLGAYLRSERRLNFFT